MKDKIGRLMLVDDNEFDQMMYKRLVERSGLVESFVQYIDPQKAVRDLCNQDVEMPDLVLLDINMPGMDGFEFLDVATEKLASDICPMIVMLTTSLDPRDKRRADGYGVVRDFMNKPLTRELLSELVELQA